MDTQTYTYISACTNQYTFKCMYTNIHKSRTQIDKYRYVNTCTHAYAYMLPLHLLYFFHLLLPTSLSFPSPTLVPPHSNSLSGVYLHRPPQQTVQILPKRTMEREKKERKIVRAAKKITSGKR